MDSAKVVRCPKCNNDTITKGDGNNPNICKCGYRWKNGKTPVLDESIFFKSPEVLLTINQRPTFERKLMKKLENNLR